MDNAQFSDKREYLLLGQLMQKINGLEKSMERIENNQIASIERIEKAQTASIERIEKAILDKYSELDERVTVLEADHQKGLGKRDALLGIAALAGAVLAQVADWLGGDKISGWISGLFRE